MRKLWARRRGRLPDRQTRKILGLTSGTYRLLDAVADSYDPLLALLTLAAPLLRKPRELRPAIRYYVATAGAIAFVYVVRAIDAHQQLWASIGLDYSTHSAFAASLAVSVAMFLRRWLAPLFAFTVLYFCLELFMRYHGMLDIVTSTIPAAAAAWLVHARYKNRGNLRGIASCISS
jgi:hypothetical protein